MGNIVNRVFDSSGPEGKVRGTPQQIIEKYIQLARDAGLSNDRVAAENFQQHAEHYTRMLGEAQREQDARREQQELQQRDRQRDRNDNNSGGNNSGGQQVRSQNEPEALQSVEPMDTQPDLIEDDLQSPPQPDLLPDAPAAAATAPAGDDNSQNDSGLVETPESKPKARRPRPRKVKPEAEGAAVEDTATESKPKRPRASRAKPKAPKDAETSGNAEGASPAAATKTEATEPPEAAE